MLPIPGSHFAECSHSPIKSTVRNTSQEQKKKHCTWK